VNLQAVISAPQMADERHRQITDAGSDIEQTMLRLQIAEHQLGACGGAGPCEGRGIERPVVIAPEVCWRDEQVAVTPCQRFGDSEQPA